MDVLYSNIIEQIVTSGKRIREKSGKVRDVGITKQHLTEEDVRIERELKEVVRRHHRACEPPWSQAPLSIGPT